MIYVTKLRIRNRTETHVSRIQMHSAMNVVHLRNETAVKVKINSVSVRALWTSLSLATQIHRRSCRKRNYSTFRNNKWLFKYSSSNFHTQTLPLPLYLSLHSAVRPTPISLFHQISINLSIQWISINKVNAALCSISVHGTSATATK